MHPNPTFRNTPEAQALQFAAERGFGILSINGPDAPLTAHVPFVIAGNRLRAHLVASNSLLRALTDGARPALMSVSGPDSYISPDWYELEDQVPTWNYIAVNLRGSLAAMPQGQLRAVLDETSDAFETRLLPKPVWKTTKMPDEALDRMMRQIRPVEMVIESVESTFKLGQNKPDTARLAAADKVDSDGIGHELGALAERMRNAS